MAGCLIPSHRDQLRGLESVGQVFPYRVRVEPFAVRARGTSPSAAMPASCGSPARPPGRRPLSHTPGVGGAPAAQIIFDRFHLQKVAQEAVDEVRREQVRLLAGNGDAKAALKKTRWSLLKSPWNLTDGEHDKLADVQRTNRPLFRAYMLKESLATIFERRQPDVARKKLLEWCGWAMRSRLRPFKRVARTIRDHLEGVLAFIATGLSNGRIKGLNGKIRTITRRAYGFHSAASLISFIFLCCSGLVLHPVFKDPVIGTHSNVRRAFFPRGLLVLFDTIGWRCGMASQQVQRFNPSSHDPDRALQAWTILIGMAQRRESTTYELLSERMFRKPAAGVLARILGHVAFFCEDHGLPPLTVIVVNKGTGIPGTSIPIDLSAASELREKVYREDWYDIVPPSPDEFAVAYSNHV